MEWGFDFEEDGFRFVSKEKDKGNSEITISREGKILRQFLFPSYKIWNIPAHAKDIIEGLKKDVDCGLRVAGSDGFGGNAYHKL